VTSLTGASDSGHNAFSIDFAGENAIFKSFREASEIVLQEIYR